MTIRCTVPGNVHEDVVAIAREMRQRGLAFGTVGNVSARTARGLLITPTRVDYDALTPADLVEIALDGTPVTSGEPSLEWQAHAAVYRARPDVGAVVHTHSPHAVGRSFDPSDLVVVTEEREYLGITNIAVVGPEPAGSRELALAVVDGLEDDPAVLVAHHGVFGVGRDPREALEMCALVEQQAVIEAWRLRYLTPR